MPARKSPPSSPVLESLPKPAGKRATLALDPARIVETAARLLEDTGRLSMRALAQELGANPMAVYHYFPGKDALIAAVAAARFSQVEVVRDAMQRVRNWQARVRLLARAYLDMVRAAQSLTRHLAKSAPPDDATDIAIRFEVLFLAAVGELQLPPVRARACMHVLVDCIHGFALGDAPVDAWDMELDVLLAGMEALAQQSAGGGGLDEDGNVE